MEQDKLDRARSVRHFISWRQGQGYVFTYADYRLLTRYVLGELSPAQAVAQSKTALFADCVLAH